MKTVALSVSLALLVGCTAADLPEHHEQEIAPYPQGTTDTLVVLEPSHDIVTLEPYKRMSVIIEYPDGTEETYSVEELEELGWPFLWDIPSNAAALALKNARRIQQIEATKPDPASTD